MAKWFNVLKNKQTTWSSNLGEKKKEEKKKGKKDYLNISSVQISLKEKKYKKI